MNDEDRYVRITLRIPKELHRSLGDAADKTSKSLNAEIVGRLQESFDEAAAATERAEQLERTLAGSRYAANFVLRESVHQISLMARSNEAARTVSEELLEGLSTAVEIGEEFLRSEVKDEKKAEIELANLSQLVIDAERRLADSRLPPVRNLFDAIGQEADALEAEAAARESTP